MTIGTVGITTSGIDPITFAIIRHRLTVINDEAAMTMPRASASSMVNEGYDCNTALLTPEGDVFVIGPYIMGHACALEGVVKYVLANFQDNPGIGPGDMFATNDPYVGAVHQHDLAVVAPIFVDGEILMWCGSVLHHVDVGSPVAGGATVAASSIYEESIPLAPIRLVENGRLRKDLEGEFLIRSRYPEMAALDLRAQITANRMQIERVTALCERYGTGVVATAVEELIDAVADAFRRRLEALPDGRWRAISFCEHDGLQDKVYAVRMTMTKRGGTLELDLRESSPQAPAVINCPLHATRGYTVATICVYLGYGLPRVPAAIWRSVKILTKEGTFPHPSWPAGCAMSSGSGGQTVRTTVATCLGYLIDADDTESPNVMTAGVGTQAIQSVDGAWDTGAPFAAWLFDPFVGGGGAKDTEDGMNSCGTPHIQLLIPNVEVTELYNPIRYLWRRERADSSGAGSTRGGVGGEHAYVLHHSRGAITSKYMGHGVEFSASAGLAGGEPGQPYAAALRHGEEMRYCEPIDEHLMEPGDVFYSFYGGGGGLGDPLERAAEHVLEDIEHGLVSVEAAREQYGVVLAGDDIDAHATASLRAERRCARLGGREPLPILPEPAPGRRLSRVLVAREHVVACRRCGTELGPADGHFKSGMHMEEIAAGDAWPTTADLPGAARFVLRRYCCPGCGTQLETEVNLADEPPLRSIEVLV